MTTKIEVIYAAVNIGNGCLMIIGSYCGKLVKDYLHEDDMTPEIRCMMGVSAEVNNHMVNSVWKMIRSGKTFDFY